ncbi:MAG: peroxidase family protein [Allosphingosinicella sp.]
MIKEDLSKPIGEAEPVDENPAIPSGYTYFGQFIDHDLTFDPTPLAASSVDVAALEDFRTPALDLDCIYGSGPDDQPYMYDGHKLRLGVALDKSAKAQTRSDLLRLPAATKHGRQPAIIGDKRNDENRIVAQLQSLFISFHNKVIDDRTLIEAVGGTFDDSNSRFRSAVNIVRWHYQWLAVNDFLARILEPGMVAEVLGEGVPNLPNYSKDAARWAYIPVEFAGAAYRFGHSMVRPGYSLNKKVLHVEDPTRKPGEQDGRISIFSRNPDRRQNLNGFGIPIPDDCGIDWAFFLDNVDRTHLPPAKFSVPQQSYRIDALLVGPLSDLPEFFGDPSPIGNLAYRNLVRGVSNLRLPSGEQVARALGIVPMTPEIIWSTGSRLLDRSKLSTDDLKELDEVEKSRNDILVKWVNGGKRELLGNTPLWFYILREAEYFGVLTKPGEGPTIGFGGQHLGPVGSRIVAETFIGLLWSDPNSYLRRWPKFQPLSPIAGPGGAFSLGRLAEYVF